MNIYSKLTGFFLLYCFTAMTIIFSQTASAGDEKSIPGTNCRAFYNQDNVSYGDRGNLINDFNGRTLVTCPIVRDNMTGNSQHFSNTVKVRLYKRSNATTVCVLDSRTWSGNSGRQTFGYASGTGYQTVYIPRTVFSYTRGVMSITCRLNDDDQIFGIVYDER